MRVWLAATTLAVLIGYAPAQAATPFDREIVCPLGGERFTYTDTMSSSSWGARPDGKPYSNWDYPIPQCPGNGLVLYKDFSTEELRQLEAIVDSAEFAALRSEHPSYIAHWLERQLAPDSAVAVWLLLRASWFTDEAPEQKARYQTEFVALTQATAFPDQEQALFARIRAANALRELGRFEEAAQRLEGAGPGEGMDADDAEAVRTFVSGLSRVIARGDNSAEPLDLIPPRMAALHCLNHEGDAGWDPQNLCGTEPVASEVAQMRQYR